MIVELLKKIKRQYSNQPVRLTDMDNGDEKVSFVYKEIIEMLDMKGTF